MSAFNSEFFSLDAPSARKSHDNVALTMLAMEEAPPRGRDLALAIAIGVVLTVLFALYGS